MDNGRRHGAHRWLSIAAAVCLVAGVTLLSAGTAFAAGSSAPSTNPILQFGTDSVSLIIPTPPCPGTHTGCEWMLFVNEPNVPGQPTVGYAVGTSGTLTVDYPANFSGIIQADVLVGPPYKLKFGRKHHIDTTPSSTTTTTPSSTTSTTVQTKATTVLPFTGNSTGSGGGGTSGGAGGQGPSQLPFTSANSSSQLPFTGADITPLLVAGTVLVLLGLFILTTLEQRRRALRRLSQSARTVPVGEYTNRASHWFLGE